MPYNFESLLPHSANELGAAEFLKNAGILHRARQCHCGSEMRQSTSSSRGKVLPNWRCTNNGCKSTKGIRPGTWLDPSKLSLDAIMKFIYWWSRGLASITFCEREIGIEESAVIDCAHYMREVCASFILLQLQHQIGGNNMTVEIDEALFTNKNNVGRVLPEQWVFGGICRESKECFMMAVDDRTSATLLAVIEERIAPGTTIMSDGWAAYNNVI